MTYIPISPHERDEMLATVGVKSLDGLFDAIPRKHRFPKLNLHSRMDRNGSVGRTVQHCQRERKCAAI